jgi:putative transposase
MLDEALRGGRPEVFNTDQGVQFTSESFTGRLETAGVTVSMDGRGRALDNVFVERLWRTAKYENIYIQGYETVPELQRGLREYFTFSDPNGLQVLKCRVSGQRHFCHPSSYQERGCENARSTKDPARPS